MQHRDAAGDRSDKEHKEPQKPENPACRHQGKHVWQGIESKPKGAKLPSGDTKENERRRERNQATQANLKDFVQAT